MEELKTLGDSFIFYVRRNINTDKNMYQDFWTEVSYFYEEIEGSTFTNNAVRKRFRRRLKNVKNQYGSPEFFEYIEKLCDEFDIIDMSERHKFKENLSDVLQSTWAEEEPVKSKELKDGMEYSTKQDFSKKAKEKGVENEYEQFLEKHDIDQDDVTNVYFKEKASGTYFTVQTRFNKEQIDFDPVEAFRNSIKEYEVPDYSGKFSKPDKQKNRLAVISLFDAHLDKIALLSETDESSDIEKNMKVFESAFDELLQSVASKSPERILFPVGNDFWHTNDFRLTTKNGTDMSDRVHVTGMDAFRLGVNLLRRCIDKARNICDVKIIPVKGNHDEDRVLYLLECLLIAYENQNDVSIIDSRKTRLYHRYGNWLFGFAHGDKERKAKELPSLMATDKYSREHWSDVEKGVFFLGDIHHERRYDYMRGKDFRGCKVMFLRSIGSTDQWHWEEGYTGIPKSAYAFVYDKDGKRTHEFKINV